jgi:hypothetical protein
MKNTKPETFVSRGVRYVIYRTETAACIMTEEEYAEMFGDHWEAKTA